MTWLFIRFYVGVLAVLFLAWIIHGTVLEHRSDADLARVIWEAHAGGARVVASKIDEASPEGRDEALRLLRSNFAYPVVVLPIQEMPETVQQQFSQGQDVVYHRDGNSHFVVACCRTRSQCVQLGPFPSYRQQEIENAVGGWMRLAVKQIDGAQLEQRQAAIEQLRRQFEISIEVVGIADLPEKPKARVARGDKVVFYEQDPSGSEQFFSVISLASGAEFVRFGPFPSFERIDQKAATTTLALVLLPAALAIAIMLRPVARQLRHVENAAKRIASGDLDARVNENRVRAARPLANSFNLMADRTQSLLNSQRELLQAVSHELRTPLARIRFAADLIETANTDQERQQRLKAVDDAAQQLDDLVGELLTYVRAESGAAELEPEHVSVHELLAEVVETNAPLHTSLRFELADDCDHVTLFADRVGLLRVISNLTRNAARFARSAITLSAEKEDAEVHIRVDDDGPGIAEADRERIFQPFVRLDVDGDSGLGLALVKRIIDGQGGQVRVGTAPAGGARFEVILPDHPGKQQRNPLIESASA